MLDILSITGPIYLTIGIGFLITRFGVFAKADMRVFGQFVIQIALPALLFNALSQRRFGDIFNADYLAAYAVGSLLVLAMAFVWARWVAHRSMSYASMFAMGMCCPNSGFVGYPVALLTLGGAVAGVSLALNMVVENLLLIPLLLVLSDLDAHGHGNWRLAVSQTLRGLVRNPMILAIVAGVLASFWGVQLPGPISRTVTLFAQASGALSLMVIGGNLFGLRIHGLRLPVAQIAAGKLLLHPLVMLLTLTWLIPVHDVGLRTALQLTAALPMLGIYAILSQRHGHEGLSSAALLATTVSSFFTLSALLWMLQHWRG